MTRRTGLQSKAHNYLLRSRHGKRLVQVMALAASGRVRWDGHAWTQRLNDGRWAGNCGWSVKQLAHRGLLRTFGRDVTITPAGRAALDAVLDLLSGATEAGHGSVAPWRKLQSADIVRQADSEARESLGE